MLPEGWKSAFIRSCVEIGRGFSFKTEQYQDSGYPVLRVSNIGDNGNISNDKNWKFISYADAKNYKNYQLKEDDILLVMVGATTGKMGRVRKENLPALLNQNMWALRGKEKDGLEQGYFSYIAYRVVENFLSSQQGSARGFLRQSDFSKEKIILPPLPEQKKIAAILSTWDRAIEGTETLLAKSQQQKKALMQQLLTGKKRLPGFTGEWKTKNLGDIADIQTGSSNRQDSLTNGEYTFFDRSEDIRTSNRYLFDCEAVIVPGEGQDFVPKYFVGKFDLHQRTYAISSFRACDGKFIFYTVGYHRSHFLSQAVGSTVKSLRLPMFQKMPLKLPPLSEQKAIATVLSTADEEIAALESDLARLRQEKKALMQQLLTGKRRVTVD
jgi:type I restriction enzyme S subunit